MPIAAERLERYKDFVDPERTGMPYNPRAVIGRLMGILSPDTKGIVVSAMDADWYGSVGQLQSRVFAWLKEQGLPENVWPITKQANWHYLQNRDSKSGLIVDGSLVEEGAVIKKAEDPFQMLYQRSLAGAELVVPIVQRAVEFVPRALAYAEKQKLQGKKPPKFVSMWRIIGAVQSTTDQRRPLSIYDAVDFLVHHPGRHRREDIHDQTQISVDRLANILPSLGDCGIMDYSSPTTETEGQPGKGWSVYTLADPQSAAVLDPAAVYNDIRNFNIRNTKRQFTNRAYLIKMIDFIKEHPNNEYECNVLAKELDIRPKDISTILSLLVDVFILKRPDPGYQGGEVGALASANDLTYMFHDLVCDPIEEVAKTLSPLPLRPWDRTQVAIYLQNYDEERSHKGPQGGRIARGLLVKILSEAKKEMKTSYIVDTFNGIAETQLTDKAIEWHLQILLGLGIFEQPKPQYYRFVKKKNK